MNPRSILITGASGFIGGQLIRAFRQSGWNAIGMGRQQLPLDDYISLDLSNPVPTGLVDRLRHMDVVLHAAARSSPWGSHQDFQRSNVDATRHIVDFAEQVRASKLIFLSSSSVYYRQKDQFDISEATRQADPPVNRYAASKQAAEEVVRRFSGRSCILRPRAVYGVGDSVLFPRILAAAQAGKLPLLVRSGSPAVGDLLSIANLVDVCVKAAEDPSIQGDYNLTDNHAVEIIPFLLDIFSQLNIPAPKRKLSTKTAFRAAWLLETLYATFLPRREPPITRFGVHVFAYSKTFDVSKMLRTFGPPRQSVAEAVQQFVTWVQSEDPYGLSFS